MKNHNGVLYREWRFDAPGAVTLLVHGLGGHSERWRFLSEFFLQNNISSYAVELKGFGETEGLKGHADSLNTYLEDIKTLHNLIAQENPGKKIFLIGESMGALLAFLIAREKEKLFDGVICISPAFKSILKFSATMYIKIFLNSIFCPEKQFRINFDSAILTRDREYQEVINSDPREHRLATAGLLINIARGQIKAAGLKNRIRMPLLFLLAGGDKMVDLEASKRIFNGLKLEDKTIFIYPGMYHALSIDLGKENVFGDIVKWIEHRIMCYA
ncbi:MAG: lysophospholipase [Candidatus Omnitrophica bacterium]|nr:lysophospholipase [Candidatus Omnitrophota bacterium]